MKLNQMVAAILALEVSALCLWAGDKPPASRPTATSTASAAEKLPTVGDAYLGLASGGLTYARLSELPKGMLLKAGEITLGEKDVEAEIAKAPKNLQEQLKKSAFFLLEQLAANRLLLRAAKAEAAEAGRDAAQLDDRELFGRYFGKVTREVKVTDEEITDFYRNNKEMFGGAELYQVRPQLGQYLLRQKQQQVVAGHIKTLGRRILIEVSASWAKQQAALARDNPVGKARASGRPSLVDFGSKGCRPCDMLAPILETLRQKYEGRLNVLFISVREEQILAARYGIRTIPVQIFFDTDGKEVFRHVGFFPQEQIEKKLAEMGVK